jgi:hypothetical protein
MQLYFTHYSFGLQMPLQATQCNATGSSKDVEFAYEPGGQVSIPGSWIIFLITTFEMALGATMTSVNITSHVH